MENEEKKKVLIEVRNMEKRFGSVVALDSVDFTIYRGEVRGLIGENGSGKSTVSSIIAGMQKAGRGEMLLNGEAYHPMNSLEAQDKGIAMIVQEAGTIANLSVAENIFLGRENKFRKYGMINKKEMVRQADELLKSLEINDISAEDMVYRLDIQSRKLVEIAKAFSLNPELLIVDETTTILPQTGRKIIYRLMKKLADEDKAVLFISHDLQELMDICDTLTVLRDGKIITHYQKEQFDEDSIKSNMVGREIKGDYYRSDMDPAEEKVVLRMDHVTTIHGLMNFSLELHEGEILGIGGLSDCGMHVVGRAAYGLEKLLTGTVNVYNERTEEIASPKAAMDAGIGYLSKDRDRESLALDASVKENLMSTGYSVNRFLGPFISFRKEKDYAQKQIEDLKIKCAYDGQKVKYLSGGNKQKIVFGKWVARDSHILIMDCPTRGIDIGVKQAMYHLMYEMKKAGKSIILISEELTELIGMSDRILMMKDGKISGEIRREESPDENQMIQYML